MNETALKAIASRRRREIRRLVGNKELASRDIAGHFDVSWPAISQNLRVLERAGHRVWAVADGEAAVTVLEAGTGRVGVVVSDVIMPHVSGIQLADWLWTRDPTIGIVLLSGYTEDTVDVERARERGAVFLSKPVTYGALVEAVDQVAHPERSRPPGARVAGDAR